MQDLLPEDAALRLLGAGKLHEALVSLDGRNDGKAVEIIHAL